MLSVVLPTYNESMNIVRLIERLIVQLQGSEFEIIIVDDDSPDKTWEVAQEFSAKDSRVRVLHRKGERGLSSAVVKGFSIAYGDTLLVMDADGQHDVRVVSELARCIQQGSILAVASRYMPGGSVGEWVTGRRILSRLGTWFAQSLPPVRVSDPMSGFFAMRADAYASIAPRMHPQGFKILFEILSCLPRSSNIKEVPLTFLPRTGGESKLSVEVEIEFVLQVIRIAVHRFFEILFHSWKIIFLMICTGLIMFFGSRAWSLRFLYLDANVRQHVQEALVKVANERGWLLSSIQLQRVTHDAVRFVYQEYQRGHDTQRCFDLQLSSTTLLPCVD